MMKILLILPILGILILTNCSSVERDNIVDPNAEGYYVPPTRMSCLVADTCTVLPGNYSGCAALFPGTPETNQYPENQEGDTTGLAVCRSKQGFKSCLVDNKCHALPVGYASCGVLYAGAQEYPESAVGATSNCTAARPKVSCLVKGDGIGGAPLCALNTDSQYAVPSFQGDASSESCDRVKEYFSWFADTVIVIPEVNANDTTECAKAKANP
jgi:hypothetical protein